MPEKEEDKEVSGEFSFGPDKIKIRFRGTYGGKIVFITSISLFYLWHVYFYLKVPFFQATLAYMLCILPFGILWHFGCPNLRTYFIRDF